ncbi:MAG TPA: CRTAC1 family protein [Bryobacteraceae bacterium]|nr:CRTAC1 family protein [Bryobacteraceae bacterium]
MSAQHERRSGIEDRSAMTKPRWSAVALVLIIWVAAFSQSVPAPIHFAYRPIDFQLDSCETAQRHAPETMAGGVAIFDFNNDGYPDLFFVNGADIRTLHKTSSKYSNRLFQNDGKGNFTDVTQRAGLAGTGYDNGVAIGDYDNDGFEDIFVGGVHGNHLYHNNGNGTFTDVTEKAGIAKPDREYGPLWSVGGAWLDVNNDGLLDLFVVNYLAWDLKTEPPCEASPGKLDYCHPKMYKATPNQLFLNNGDGTFRDISLESGIRSHPGKGMGAAIADFDQDGWMDIFVANDKLYNSLFRNKGGGKFEEISFDAGVALTEEGKLISGMGVDARDLDNDGWPEIAFSALDYETFPIFRNLGKFRFDDITQPSGMARLTAPMAGYSLNIADFDNDGWKDMFVARGHVQSLSYAAQTKTEQPNTVFRNLGHAKFQALTAEAGFAAQPPARHRGSAVGDLNGDGRLDLVSTALSAPAELWINDSPSNNHWLELRLQGTKSNRDAVGARIKLVAGGNTQYEHVSFASGYASASAGPVHFGLGSARSAETIEIHWPSGTVQSLKNMPADRLVKIKEPDKR